MKREEKENAEEGGPELDETVNLAVRSALHVEIFIRETCARALLLVEVEEGLVELLLEGEVEGGEGGEEEIDDGDVHGDAVEALVATVGEKKRKEKRNVLFEKKRDEGGRI